MNKEQKQLKKTVKKRARIKSKDRAIKAKEYSEFKRARIRKSIGSKILSVFNKT